MVPPECMPAAAWRQAISPQVWRTTIIARVRRHPELLVAAALALLPGCGGHDPANATNVRGSVAEAQLQSRPIGRPERFHAPAPERAVSACRPNLGRRDGVHIELFAEDRVVVIPAGIGTRPPRRSHGGRIVAARCFGPIATIEPTGLVLVRRGSHATAADFFRQWGIGLRATGWGTFEAAPGKRIVAYVRGRRWRGAAAAIPLRRHAQIVLEVGPHIPPHRFYTFPPGW
jgi:hypothetical protein